MKKAVIVGVYEYIGFHLCSRLLEQGEEIIGMPFSDEFTENVEDKKLEIGRNANFIEKTTKDIIAIKGEEVEYVFIDLYTLNSKKIDTLRANLFSKERLPFSEQWKGKKVVILSSITTSKSLSDIVGMDNTQMIYLPTIYGPWQTKDFLFQQLISKDTQQVELNRMEYTKDAIFIEDVITEILDQAKSDSTNSILMESAVESHWQLCQSYLKDTTERKNDFRIVEENLMKIKVKNRRSIAENIDRQRNHYRFYRI